MYLICCVNKSQFVLMWPKPYNTEQQSHFLCHLVHYMWPYLLTGHWLVLISQIVKIVVCLFVIKYMYDCVCHSAFGSWCITCVFLSRTFQQECPMHISLCASEDGQTLETKSLSLDHNQRGTWSSQRTTIRGTWWTAIGSTWKWWNS